MDFTEGHGVDCYMLFIFYSLVEDLNYLNEVVVIGYGTQTRQKLTGSVASVDLNFVSH